MAHHLKTALALGVLLAAAAPAAFAQPVAERAPLTVAPDTDEYLQHSASVEMVNNLEHQGDLSAALFGTGGGDPAMNGLYTYVSFYMSPAEGWRVFRIGDFNSYRIVSETPGHVLIQVEENVMGEDGVIGSQTRRIMVSWTAPADGTPPNAVTMTTVPANQAN